LKDSRIPGLYRMTVRERINVLREGKWLDSETAGRLERGAALMSAETADRMIENVIGVFGLPLAVAPNFRINGRDYVIPMAVEEPSIVAAVSGAARLSRRGGGFQVDSDESLLIGQIFLTDIRDPAATAAVLDGAKEELVRLASRSQPNLGLRGGGARGIEVFQSRLPAAAGENSPGEGAVVVHLLVDTCDAMGANTVNSMCEGIAPRIEELTSGTAVLRILSNLADRSVVRARVTLSLADLGNHARSAERVRDAIVLATRFAHQDPYRAATHNKGIMNGIDAVAIATGNDWRAIEAGAHAYAARDGAYRSLTTWTVDSGGNLVGELALPMKVGIVGGSLGTNPAVAVSLQIAGVKSAAELGALMAAVGLAQNFAALRALVTEGIQKGHMSLHARSVAASAGTPARHFDSIVAGLIESGDIKLRKAKELLATLHGSSEPDETIEVHGRAVGKVILLGEHAVVYGRHALALPVPAAVSASVRECPGEMRIEFREREDGRALSPTSPQSLSELVHLIVRRLGLQGGQFDVRVTSNIPRASGLGSSAATAVALIRAFDNVHSLGMPNDAINGLAFECEKLAHGNPSGVDNTVATYGEAVLYCKAQAPPVKALTLHELPPLVIAVSGQRASTREQVESVRRRHARAPDHYDAIFDEVDTLTNEGAAALVRRDYGELGMLMNLCHGLLNAMEVSTPELERMVDIARRSGAAGAKLTGAGGGGSIVALCPEAKDRVEQALRDAGYRIIN
jgi:hydroxymethylglutaryl-CoA reductase